MKIPYFILVAVLIVSLGMAVPPTTHTITLNVDTGTINNSNVHEVCNFGQDAGTSNEDFTTEVKPGDIVVWVGVSSSAPETDVVLINSINHEGGARVFSKNVLKDSQADPGVVVGVVSKGKDGDNEKYKVNFKVLNNGVARNGTFHIDPIIKVKK